MRRLVVVALLSVAVTGASIAQTYPTIVGEWYDVEHGKEDCGGQWSIHIEPKSLYGSENFCAFSDVRRDKWMVVWEGTCGYADEDGPETVVATENPRTRELALSFSSGGTITLRSCKPR